MKKAYISPSANFYDFIAEEDMLTNSHPPVTPIAVIHHTEDPDPTEWTNVGYVGLFEEDEETVDGISDWSDEDQF